ncbi:hypothetical protein [Streptomyces sp. NPDC049555]|uniref:hypothetical protein n=1 Tax=Streptomyces sp. NPDC049555 TaxID=3154930 RepID=UPI0034198991
MSTNTHSSHPLAHRTVLTVPQSATVLQDVRRISSAWLIEKYGSAPLASGQHDLADNCVLASQSIYQADGAEHALRLQLREDKPEATWRTTITAALCAGECAVVSVALEAFPNGDQPLSPGRPRLVRELVRDLAPVDGLSPLTLDARPVHADQVDALVDVLCEPRRLPVVVAARPVRPDAVWSDRMRQVLPQCAGAAALYLLEDLDAVDAFRKAIGDDHRVAPGAVRTFLTDVDPAWPQDAPRHRFLTMARLSDHSDRAWYGIASTVQRLSTEAPLPAALRGLSFPDLGQLHREERQAALAEPRHTEELGAMAAQIARLTASLKKADQDLKEATREADLSARTKASLEEQLQIAVARADGDLEEAVRALDDLERARAEVRVLRRRLYAAGRHREAVLIEQPLGVPASFEDLWERLDTFEGLTVSADKGKALELDEAARARVWAAKAWNALRALDAYTRSAHDGFNGGFYEYCTSEQPGDVWPRKQVAMAETGATMNAWGDERIFPVPPDVAPTGRLEMQAHLKLHSKGSTSPRIYFHDDTKGCTGRVIVGYIGHHLKNKHTN